ncbi:MAG: DUF488 domain-containing protein [Stenotrophomonas sp.]
MEIHIRRAYEPATDEDGSRFLVDRLWPRGVSHAQLAAHWLKDVAPSTELRQWFDHRADRWDEFRQRYWQELAAQPKPLAALRDALEHGPVTLVYGAHDSEHNQAVALREYLLAHARRPH